MKNRDWKFILLFAGLTALLIFGLSAAGIERNGKEPSMSGKKAAEGATSGNGQQSEPAQNAGPKLLMGAAENGAAENGAEAGRAALKAAGTGEEESQEIREADEISLTEADRSFLDELIKTLGQGDLEGGARLLSDYEIPWKEFPCMYDGEVMKTDVFASHGLVFTKSSTLFYGDFSDGMPQGSCTALQVLDLEEGRRYDYAYGIWEKGELAGEGECGYNYYDGAGPDIARKNAKKGMFKDNRMEGEITYTSTGEDGITSTWQFSVADGVIVIDDKWLKSTDSAGAVIYKLTAQEDPARAYTLSGSAAGEERWKNLISFGGPY